MWRRTRTTATLVIGFVATFLAQPLYAEDTATPSDTPPSPQWDFVEFEVNSWGMPITSWRILPNGGGSWTEAVRDENAPPFSAPSLAWHEIEPDTDNYIALEKILTALPEPAPDPDECENFMTDMPYGKLRLTRGATTTEIAWNSGCLDDGYVAFMGILQAADTPMQTLGKAAPVTRTEPTATD